MDNIFTDPTVIQWSNPHSKCVQMRCPVTLEMMIYIDGENISGWLRDNGIKNYTFFPQTLSQTDYAMILYFAFENPADAALFALRWA